MTLPQGWTEVTIGEIATFNPKHSTDSDRTQPVSFVPMPAVDEELGAIVHATDRALGEIWTGYTHFAEGDVIFAKITPCMENGKAAVATSLTNGLACGSTEFYVLRPQGVEAGLLWRFLRQQSFRAEAENHMSGAVGQRRVPRQFLENHPFPLPPKAEQRRMVAKLDRLTARLARARAELDRVPVLTREMRQATLAAAFTGRLSNEWRSSTSETHHTSTLERLRLDRDRARAALGFKKKGANRVAPSEQVKLPELPSSWLWVTFEECALDLTVGHVGPMKDRYTSSGIPFLRSLNVKSNAVSRKDLKYIDAEFDEELRKSRLYPGDMVVVRTGDPGVAAVIPDDLPSANCSDLVIFRATNAVDPHFAAFFMNSDFARKIVSQFQVGIAQQHFNVGAMSATPLPLPSREEQSVIVDRIKAAFARADRLEAEAARARTLLDRFEAELLAKAFRGELVPQDPSDEPASVLVARIRAQRAVTSNAKRGRRSRGTADA